MSSESTLKKMDFALENREKEQSENPKSQRIQATERGSQYTAIFIIAYILRLRLPNYSNLPAGGQ